MAKEKSGYQLGFSFTPDSGTKIDFDCKSKQVPGVKTLGKIDINTDASPAMAERAPSDQYEGTDGKVTAIYDAAVYAALLAVLNTAGDLVITSAYTAAIHTFGNAWIAGVEPGSTDNNGNPTMDITFELGGGTTGIPATT